MKIVGVDVGSTTVKAVLVEDGEARWRDYQRHNTKQAEMVLRFLERLETECGLAAGRDRVMFTGSGAGFVAPLVGGKLVQEVVAVAAAVERLHPAVRFVSVGRALPEHEVRIVRGDGSPAPERHVGRLHFRGPSATSGYHRNPVATAAIDRGEGWLDRQQADFATTEFQVRQYLRRVDG